MGIFGGVSGMYMGVRSIGLYRFSRFRILECRNNNFNFRGSRRSCFYEIV